MPRALALLTAVFMLTAQARAEWTPTTFSEESTLEFMTDCPEEGEHWSPVWLAVVDGDVYVRLGKKAAERFDCSRKRPYVGIEIADERFGRVEMVEAPDMIESVGEAMSEKYFWDFLFGAIAHPYTMRLVPAPAPQAAP